MPHRRGRVLEYFSLDAVRSVAAEICLCQVRRTGPADNGQSSGRIEAQSASHADRRCRPARKMVLPVKSGVSRIMSQWRRDATSHGWPCQVEVEKLKRSGNVSLLSWAAAAGLARSLHAIATGFF